MPSILDYLNTISDARYGRDVRQAIVDAISACYQDGRAGVSDLEARRLIESAIGVNESQQADIDTLYAQIAEIQGGGGEGSQESTTITLDTVIYDGGFVDSVTVNNNATKTYDVTFTQTFTEVPEVFACVAVQNSAAASYSKVTVGIVKAQTTKTGFRFFIANTSGATRSTTVVWAAFQPTTKEIDLDITIPSGDGMSEADVRAITNPIQTSLDGIKTGYDGTVYSTPGEAVRTQINDLHVLIGDEPGTAISGSAVSYDGTESGLTATNVQGAVDELSSDVSSTNERLDELDERIADGVTEDLGNSITPTWTSGKYIQAANGREGNNSDTSVTDFIPIEVNGIAKTITFTTWLVNTMCVGLYREDKSFISGISVTGSQIAELSDTVSREDAAYIRITCYNNKIEDGFKVKYTDMNSDHVADGSIGGEQIADKAITNEKLYFNRQIPTTNKLRRYTAGGYINATTGRVTANSTMLYTDYIPLEEGKMYYARGFNGTYNAFYDADFGYVAGCTISKSKFTVPEGQNIAYGRFTITSADAAPTAYIYKNDHLPPAYREELYATDFDMIADKTITAGKIQFVEHDPWTNYIDMDKAETGFYIKADGDKGVGSELFCSDYIELEEGVTYYANEVTGQYCAFYDENYVYVSSFQLSSLLINYAFTLPTGAKYGRVSWPRSSANPSVSRDRGTPRAYGICQKSVRNAFNDVIPTDYRGEDIGLFNKILCCGDSLTAGGFNNDQGISIVNTKGPLYCWPTQLGKLTGCGITNKSISGLTTPGWWSAFGNDDLSGHDAAIISLGVNDGAMLGGFTEEVETAYRNIINKLETENKGIKIFLTTVPHAMSYGSSRTYSAALIAFAESLNDPNVIIIDMNLYSHLLEAMAYNCGHLSAYGYWRLAADYKAYISWYMATHKEEFRFIQFVGTDYTYSGGGATTGEI